MTENRFQWVFIKDNELEFRDNGIVKRFDNYRLEEFLNELANENEQLKSQLYYNGDSVCNICNHQHLVETEKYYVAKCKKGYEKCSKEDVKHCKDFER